MPRRLSRFLPIALLFAGFLILAIGTGPVLGEDPQKPGHFEGTVTMKVELDYLLYLPKDYEKQEAWPLMLFLHGAGERGADLEKVKVHGPPKLIAQGKDFPCIVVSPQCPEHRWWEPEVLIELVDQIANRYKVDKSRIYATGLSMGGYATWALAAQYPKAFAAIAPICGGGDPEKAKAHAMIPTWVFHGGKDTVVPLARSEEMVAAIKAAGGDAKLTVYPEAGHDSWTATYDNPEFYAWLFKQKKAK